MPTRPDSVKALVFVGVVMLHGASALAQDEPIAGHARPRFGPAAGLNVATISSTAGPEVDYDVRGGFAVGGIAVLSVGSNLSVQSGLLLSQKGAKYGEEPRQSITVVYVEAPALLRFHLNSGSTRPYALGGANGAVLVWSKPSYLRDWNVGTSRFDLGVVLGAGVEIVRGNSSFLFEARYTHGFVDLITCDCATNQKARHRAGTLLVGLLF